MLISRVSDARQSHHNGGDSSGDRRHLHTVAHLAVAFGLAVGGLAVSSSTNASATVQRLDLRVLVLDDNSPWVHAVAGQLDVEGVPYRAVILADPARPVIDDAFLASGDRGFFQAIVSPNYTGGSLSSAELTALRSYETTFAVREIDGFNWANPAVGLNYAGYTGDLAGVTATATAQGKAQGFQYLNGPVPFSQGSYSYVAEPLTATSNPPMPSGASFTTLVSAPIPSTGGNGSIVGIFAKGGVEQMIITAAMNFYLPQFEVLAHGIITWATRGVHLGYNRNRMTFHVDDAFNEDALWDAQHNCTPGEDCPRDANGNSIYPLHVARMTPADVDQAVQWQTNNQYSMTLAFNGFYAAANDQLTQSLVANKQAFRWLNHGLEHIYQGCTQDFTVVPWRCATDVNGQIVWRSQDAIYREITDNIAVGASYGLPFNQNEYLSGEHSGLKILPQQPDDNPNFIAALTQAGIQYIGSDASREPAARPVGSASTVPRHPTAVYYNAATVEQEVDEYNWLYTSRADGGSGYCEDNPATATCIPPLNTSTGYSSYIVPTDAAYDLRFILSNDPRPFYAHTSNLTGDRILYPLLDAILGTYRAAFAGTAPLLNLSMGEASRELNNQAAWAANGMSSNPAVSAYVQQGKVVITNNGGVPVPITVPEGASVAGATLEMYGGERSAWLAAAASTTVDLQPPALSTTGSTTFTVGQAGSVSFTVAANPQPTMSENGALPAGLTFVADANGVGTISGTPAAGTAGAYPITITATTGSGRYDYPVSLNVNDGPQITSASSLTVRERSAFSFTITSTGTPTPVVSMTGDLPTGVVFNSLSNGTATISGTPQSGTVGTYAINFTAANAVGSVSQPFTLTIGQPPVFTSATSATGVTGQPFSFVIAAKGPPTPTITKAGALPGGLTFAARTDGTTTLTGTPGQNSYGTYQLTFTATNSFGTTKQTFTLTINKLPTIFSSDAATFTVATAGSFTVRSEAFPRASVTMTGTLPAGVTFTPSSTNGTGLLSGTPSVGTGGRYALVFTATNTIGSTSQNFTLSVREAPKITSPASVTFTRGQASSFQITTTGWPTPTISKTGTLPPGISFTTASNGTALLAGTPTTTGTWTFTITAKNALATVTQTLTITVL